MENVYLLPPLTLPITSDKDVILLYGILSKHHGMLQLEEHSEKAQYPLFRDEKSRPREVKYTAHCYITSWQQITTVYIPVRPFSHLSLCT